MQPDCEVQGSASGMQVTLHKDQKNLQRFFFKKILHIREKARIFVYCKGDVTAFFKGAMTGDLSCNKGEEKNSSNELF